jgi:hypothetical protein
MVEITALNDAVSIETAERRMELNNWIHLAQNKSNKFDKREVNLNSWATISSSRRVLKELRKKRKGKAITVTGREGQ